MRMTIRSVAIRCGVLAALAVLLALPAAAQPAAPGDAGEDAAVEENAGAAVVEEEIVDEVIDPADAAVPEVTPATDGGLNYTFVELVQFGGWVGYVIIALSVIAVALIIDYALVLRPKVLQPPQEITEIRALIAAGRAAELASGEPRPSFVGGVVAAGAAELGRGYDAMVKAMEDRADEIAGRLMRRIEYLNLIANVAPMLGLLGTVIGMVEAFNTISVSAGGADPRLLASGIFKALMTTVMGLMVAIPAYFAFGIFRNRVDSLVADATVVAEELMDPVKAETMPAAVPPLGAATRGRV